MSGFSPLGLNGSTVSTQIPLAELSLSEKADYSARQPSPSAFDQRTSSLSDQSHLPPREMQWGGKGALAAVDFTRRPPWRGDDALQLFLKTMTFYSVIARCFQRVRSEREQRGGEVRQGAPGLRPKRLPRPDQRRPARKLSSLLTLLPGHED